MSSADIVAREIIDEQLVAKNATLQATGVLTEYPGIGAKALVTEVVRRHTAQGCMFAPNTLQIIAERIGDKTEIAFSTLIGWLDSLEIYCPHEGIDRRAQLFEA